MAQHIFVQLSRHHIKIVMTLTIQDNFTSVIHLNWVLVSGLSDNSGNSHYVYLQKGVFSHVEWTSPEIGEEGLCAGV